MQAAKRADGYAPALHAGLIQAAAAGLASALWIAGVDLSVGQWAVLQAAVAVRIATLAGAACWWLPLHLGFAPSVVAASAWQLPPLWWGGAFLALLAVYGSTYRTRVPLFLSAPAVHAALARLLPVGRPVRFIDLGCGLGGAITALKARCPHAEFEGVELAPLPYLISRLRAARAGCRVERRDLMAIELAPYDVVYAFLSPDPMPALWAKAKREMRPGSLFVSLAFPVPGVAPERVVHVSEQSRHTLYVWRM